MNARPGRTRLALALAAAALLLPSCVSFGWTRTHTDTAIAEADLERLPDDAHLSDCLALLGAPLRVWELPDDDFAIAYGWFREQNLGGRVSVPITDFYGASFRYDDVGNRAHGLVLFFDEDERLRHWRFGFLRDLLTGALQEAPVSGTLQEAAQF